MGRRVFDWLDAEEATALIYQKPPLHRRVKICLLYDGFFSLAVVRQNKSCLIVIRIIEAF